MIEQVQRMYRYWEITGKYSTDIACSKKGPQAAAVPVPGDRHKMERNCGQATEDFTDEITACRSTEGIPSNTTARLELLLVRNCKCRQQNWFVSVEMSCDV